MGRFVAVVATALAVALALLGVIAFNLGGVAAAHRDEIVARAERALGRRVRVARVGPSYWPLGVRLEGVVVSEDPRFGGEPFLEADGIVVTVRLLPLLRGRIETAGVTLERPRITLVRDNGGHWNLASIGTGEAGKRPGGERGARKAGVRVPVEWLVGLALAEIRDGTIDVRDHGGREPRTLVASDVRLRADDVRLGGTPRVRASGRIALGGHEATFRMDLHAATRLGTEDLVRMEVHGQLAAQDVDAGPVVALFARHYGWDATFDHLAVRADGNLGRFGWTIDARAPAQAVRLADRELALPATALHLRGRRVADAVTLEEATAVLGSFTVAARGAGRLEPWRMVLTLRSEEGASASVPLGEPPVRVDGLVASLAVDAKGATVRAARVRLDGAPVEIRARARGIEPLDVTGRFTATALGGTLGGDLESRGGPDAAFTIRTQAHGLDAARVAARLAPEIGGRLEGSLDASLATSVRLVGWRPDLQSATGGGALTLAAGRLRGVNLAHMLLAALDDVPFVPEVLGKRGGARYGVLLGAEDMTIEHATVPFALGGGRLSSEGMVVVAPPYEVTATGSVDRQRRVELRGDVTLAPALSEALRDDVHAIRVLCANDGRVVIPFRMRGQLGRARPEPDSKRLRARGLQRLVENGLLGGARAQDDRSARRGSPDRERPADDWMLERLQRMLRP